MSQSNISWRRLILPAVLIIVGILVAFSPLLMQSYAQFSQQKMIREAAQQSKPEQPSTNEQVYEEADRQEEDPTVEIEEQEEAEEKIPREWPFSTLKIPKLDIEAVVVEGVEIEDLRRGPGHYPKTAMPGENDNIGIAGHRTTYGAWFRHVDQLEKGDEIYLVTKENTYLYEVEKVWVIDKHDWSVVDSTSYAAVTLTTCEPPYSDEQRLAVRAKLVEVTANQ